MAALTVHPEHVDGVRALIEMEFEGACEVGELAVELAPLRELIAVCDDLGWDSGTWQPWRDAHAVDVPLSGELLDKLTAMAWREGTGRLADIREGCMSHIQPSSDVEQLEREARSMLAWHQYMQGQKVAS